MRNRTPFERLLFSASIICFGLTLSGTKACQEDYFFASQSNATPAATVTSTPTNDDDDDDDGLVTVTPTSTATVIGQASATPTVAPTATIAIASLALLDTFRSVGTRSAAEEAAEAAEPKNPYAEALKGKPENWIGKAFAAEPLKAITDSDSDGFSDWLEVLMGSNPGDATSTPPSPVTTLKDRLGMDSQVAEERLKAFEQSSTNPVAHSDVDGDGLRDNLEVAIGSDPNGQDTDQDGIWDGKEFDAGSDPVKPEATQK